MDNQEASFREQTAQRLANERAAKEQPAAPEAIEPAEAELEYEPTLEADSEIDVVDDSDSVTLEEAPTDEDSELDSEPTDDEGAEEPSEWQSKYEELEKEYRRATSHNKEREEFYAKAQTEFVQMRHEFDDTLSEAKRGAQYFGNIARQQLQQLQQVNPATLPPEQQQQYYQALNNATQQSQQFQGALENIAKQEEEQRSIMKQREAEIAKAAIKARIPEWSNDVYSEIGSVAQEFGYTHSEFSDTTDARFILMANEIRKVRKAAEAVTNSTKQRKANPPRSRAAQSKTRNDKGQFIKAQDSFMSNPGQKGAFAAMKAQQLKRERQGR